MQTGSFTNRRAPACFPRLRFANSTRMRTVGARRGHVGDQPPGLYGVHVGLYRRPISCNCCVNDKRGFSNVLLMRK